ncbi:MULTISPECIES: hemolysin family protein [Niallia]|uniref:Transporter associated domain protein n=1 Tax=Niallia circulans TaxID=1397 RepID=A0A268FF16_NIACI|nr:hemolysin family protein [Niallia circulans]AYV68402.1 HlyC/CorC family transporter [Niallia circulans]AYV73198.1 HlyC/CorC family transporter [Niallia circulans]NRG26662.1 HlyC/CorC family transporter [Niallia circulans]PAD83961.1 transporter associated domain protein [Niallia circulans]QJX64315.1 HlyC/CorC family transporter [Niallia circulans]
MDIITIINLFLLVLLLALTAFFVGAEFAVVKIRMSRIDQLIAEGNKKAIMAKKVASELDYYLSACQLGITVTALGLGALGKPAIEQLLYPIFNLLNASPSVASVASYAIAFALVTFLHVVVGEMAPKTLAIQFAEKLTLLLAPPLYWFGKVMKPFIWALNGSAQVVLRLMGIKPAKHEQAYSEEELKIVMTQSYQGGEIDQTELEYMENVFSFDERVAKDIMVPRTELVTLNKDMSYEEIVKVLDEHNYTRYPVTEDGDKDHIIGVVNVKKMLTQMAWGRNRQLDEFVRDLPVVLEVTRLQDALLKMQQERVHMLLVIDEYGGTSGILAMEDILEELVGEIRDEFDADEVADIRESGKDKYFINGRVLLDELEERFGIPFEEREELDTIAGWIQYQLLDTAKIGDQVEQGDRLWTVTDMDNYQIKEVSLIQNAFKTI